MTARILRYKIEKGPRVVKYMCGFWSSLGRSKFTIVKLREAVKNVLAEFVR